MPENVQIVDYFYTFVDDKPGQGYRILARMKRRRINLLAFTTFPSGPGQVQLNFFPNDQNSLLAAAAELNIRMMGPKKAFLIQGDDKIGALADVFRMFYKKDINIFAANCVSDDRGGYGLVLWISPRDIETAAKVLGVKYEPDSTNAA